MVPRKGKTPLWRRTSVARKRCTSGRTAALRAVDSILAVATSAATPPWTRGLWKGGGRKRWDCTFRGTAHKRTILWRFRQKTHNIPLFCN
eukprot:10331202-Prorocentrum_lima.AAC.1